MNTKCRLFGHKIDKNFTDGRYHICERCQMHEYWDSKNIMIQYELKFKYSFESAGLLLKPYFFILRQYYNLKYYIKYQIIRIKNLYFLNDDDLPF